MGDKINQIRKEKGLTVEEFASLLGYSISSIIKIIYKEREPSKCFLRNLKKVFPETDLNSFFTT